MSYGDEGESNGNSDDADDPESTMRDLLTADTIAVVGCSTTPGKPAHDVPKYLQEHGYRIIPVNPFAEAVLGEPAYNSLTDIPLDITIDVVNVFRPSEEASGVVDDVLARRDAAGDVAGLWLQLGIHDDEAAVRAEAAGIAVLQDRCMKVAHRQLIG